MCLKLVASEHHCCQLFDFCLQGDGVGNSTDRDSKSLKIPVILSYCFRVASLQII